MAPSSNSTGPVARWGQLPSAQNQQTEHGYAMPPHNGHAQAADHRAANLSAMVSLPAFNQRAPTHSDSAVGREIRELRRAQGRTQKDLARAVGVTGAQLHRYETGTTRIAASRLIAIADALGIGANALIAAGSATVPPPPPPSCVGSGDIVELIELFSTISDPRHRSALVAVARMMATQYAAAAYPPGGAANEA